MTNPANVQQHPSPVPRGAAAAESFWREALAVQGSVTPAVLPSVILIGASSSLVCLAAWLVERRTGVRIGLAVGPYEIAGAVLGLLLVMRTNAGYDRWWEGRKLWGGIVNQCRNLATSGLAYGPPDVQWQDRFRRWTTAFAYASCSSLRGNRNIPELTGLLGPAESRAVTEAEHMPGTVALGLALLLEHARSLGMDRFAYLRLDEQRALLIDHVGGCERILKTPLPRVLAIKIRRFIMLFFLAAPFGLLHDIRTLWLIPLIVMFAAYPVLSLEQIGVELQNPFSETRLGHLPLDDIVTTIDKNLAGLCSVRSELEGLLVPESHSHSNSRHDADVSHL